MSFLPLRRRFHATVYSFANPAISQANYQSTFHIHIPLPYRIPLSSSLPSPHCSFALFWGRHFVNICVRSMEWFLFFPRKSGRFTCTCCRHVFFFRRQMNLVLFALFGARISGFFMSWYSAKLYFRFEFAECLLWCHNGNRNSHSQWQIWKLVNTFRYYTGKRVASEWIGSKPCSLFCLSTSLTFALFFSAWPSSRNNYSVMHSSSQLSIPFHFALPDSSSLPSPHCSFALSTVSPNMSLMCCFHHGKDLIPSL
jgi:hypothetical protein